jgi:hypothetical protein
MKSYPSNIILNDPVKRNVIDQILIDLKLDLTSYMSTLTSSIIKDKQILTSIGKEMLSLPEHELLLDYLKKKYPQRNFESMLFISIFNIIRL